MDKEWDPQSLDPAYQEFSKDSFFTTTIVINSQEEKNDNSPIQVLSSLICSLHTTR